MARRAHYSVSTLAEAAKGDRLPSEEVTLAYVAACGGDLAEWRVRWSAVAAAVAAAITQQSDTSGTEERSPYRGLMPYQPEEADWFFGRSALIDRLLNRVERLPLVGVIGASGSGKSSLLRAGLMGAVAADKRLAHRWRTMLLTPTDRPLEALSGEVAKWSGTDPHQLYDDLVKDPSALDVVVRGALAADSPDARALLVVDQFEETFTLCDDRSERRRFLDALLDSAQGRDGRITVVLGVRSDFLGHLAEHAQLLEALNDEAHLLVGPVTGADLREIIALPAAKAGLSVEPHLLATVLADATDQPGALPLVSHALLETWQRREAGANLTLSAYQASGGVRGAIAQTAERVYGGFGAAEQQAARRIFLRLAALGDGTEDTRRRIARAELDGVAQETVTSRVLQDLVGARLVVVSHGAVEVAHEALIRAWPRLHRWLADGRADLSVHRRLTEAAQTWTALNRDPGALYRGAQLATVRGLAEDRRVDLNDLERSFLRASAALTEAEGAAARHRARLLRRLVAAMSVLLVLAVTGAAVAVRQGQDALRQRRVASANELSLRARSLVATDPELAGLLAAEAAHLHADPETLGSVLSAASAPRRMELNVGGPPISAVAFSPDHSLLAAAAGDGTIGLWDPVHGSRVGTLTGHAGRAGKLAFSADGSRLASVGLDQSRGSIIVWDTRTRQPLIRLAEDNMSAGMSFSPDGTMLAVGVTTAPGQAGTGGAPRPTAAIALHDLRTGARMLLPAVRSPVKSLSFASDGKLLASADGVDRPKLWDVAARTFIELPAEHVSLVAFGDSGHVLAAAADDRGVYLWNVNGGRPVPLRSMPLSDGYAWTISAPAGDTLAVADENGAITIWDLRRHEPRQTFQDRGRTETVSVALSRDATLLASAGFNGTIVLHDLGDTRFGGFTAPLRDVKVSPDGTAIASAGSDRTVRLWDTNGKLTATLAGHPDEVQAVAFSPNRRLLATVTRNSVVTIWDTRTRQHVAGPLSARGIGASTDIAFDPDGGLLAAATMNPTLWNVHSTSHPIDISRKYDSRIVTSLAFSPDGRRLLGASVGGYLNAWDATTGELLSRVNTGQNAVQDIAVSPDGHLLATAGDSRTIKLWDASTGREVGIMRGHTAPVQVLAFSRDGRRIASAGDDHTIMVWDTATRQHVTTLTGHTGRIRGLGFTSTGTLISGAEDGRIISWSLDLATAEARVCAGRSLTRQEWAAHVPSVPYRPSCGRPSTTDRAQSDQ
ncbi:NACHT and WD repeat domain-containing protein [Micromonospora chersina]|uniref:NACHT and WD repeat domain-containing protein n=1 Tax=Micromonospora chersina TaxID=47854 RepID=UPI003720C1C3